jgi:hypothetical protein
MIIISPSSLCLFILILAFYNLFVATDVDIAIETLFFTSFLLAIGTLIYSPFAIYLLLLFVSLPIIKTPRFREFLIIIIGYLMPFYLFGLYYFIMDKLDVFTETLLSCVPAFSLSEIHSFSFYTIPVVFIALFFIIAYLRYRFQSASKTIRLLIYNRVLMASLLFSTLAFIFLPFERGLLSLYALPPIAVFAANMMAEERTMIFNQVIFSLLLVWVVISQYLLLVG